MFYYHPAYHSEANFVTIRKKKIEILAFSASDREVLIIGPMSLYRVQVYELKEAPCDEK